MSAGELPTTEANVLKGHKGAVLAARFNSDGNYCLSCGKDRTVRLWNPHRGMHIKTYKYHGREVRDVHSFKTDCCLTNTDAHVTGGSEDGSVFFWDLVDASVVSSFHAHSSVVTSVSYHPKDSCMITASVDSTIRVWKT